MWRTTGSMPVAIPAPSRAALAPSAPCAPSASDFMKVVKAKLGATDYTRFQELLKALRQAGTSPAAVLEGLACLLGASNSALYLQLAAFLPAEHKELHAAHMKALLAEARAQHRTAPAAAALPGLAPREVADVTRLASRKRFDRDVLAGRKCCMAVCDRATLLLPYSGSCGHVGCGACWELGDYECGACGVTTRKPALAKRFFG